MTFGKLFKHRKGFTASVDIRGSSKGFWLLPTWLWLPQGPAWVISVALGQQRAKCTRQAPAGGDPSSALAEGKVSRFAQPAMGPGRPEWGPSSPGGANLMRP